MQERDDEKNDQSLTHFSKREDKINIIEKLIFNKFRERR